MFKFKFILALIFAFVANAATAAPQPYDLDQNASQIAFTFDLQGDALTGTVPVRSAAIQIDFDNVANSSIDVSFDMQSARAGVVFATEAMKASNVLNTAQFPTARFQSTRIRQSATGAELTGQLTMRGVTQPIVLNARFFRAAGSDPSALNDLQIALTGQLNRNSFGASGYADLVAPNVALDVRVNIRKR